MTQITSTLLGRSGISSLQIVSHGQAGELDFGSDRLNLGNVSSYAAQLQSWSQALTDDADILLYGCNVASGELGQAFVQILSQLTGADVAASDDLTGSTALGGNWELEFNTGSIEANLVFAPTTILGYGAVLDAVYIAAQQFSGSSVTVQKVFIDSTGNVYTTGNFTGTADFDPGIGVFNFTSAGGDDIFISKLDSNGSFVWAKQMGGMDEDLTLDLNVDSIGNVYTTGSFSGIADFDPGVGVFNLTSAEDGDIFISKLDSSGSFVWAKQMGGTFGGGRANGISVDSAGSIYTTGGFGGTVDFDPGVGVFNLTSAGGADIFISKLDSSGSFVWAKQMGGTSTDVAYDISVDSAGNILTTGNFNGAVDFNPGVGVFNLTSARSADIFISKLDSSGTFVWAKQLAGTSGDLTVGISVASAVDSADNVYLAGYFFGTPDFDPGVGVFNLTSVGSTDIFISKLDSSGNSIWVKQLGGAGMLDFST